MPQLFNRPENKHLRRKLRQQEIGAEKRLWYKIRRDQLGFRFRRQFGIGKYIVDFYCPALKLIIEIDGATHSTEAEIKYDATRQKFLESKGLTVKRYNNSDVYKNLDLVVSDIYEMCKHLSHETK
jgi:very-short-patch-repair endonuclease